MKKIIIPLLILVSAHQYGQTRRSDTLSRDQIRMQKDLFVSYLQKNSTFLKNNFDKKYTVIGDFLPTDGKNTYTLAKVSVEDCWGYIDEKGKEIIPPFYRFISQFNNGIAILQYTQDDDLLTKCTRPINDKGVFLLPECAEHSDGYIMPQKKNSIFTQIPNTPYLKYGPQTGYGIINRDGKTVVPTQYKWITFEGQHFICQSQDEKTIDIYSEDGKLVYATPGRSAYHIKDQYYSVGKTETSRFDVIDMVSKRKILRNFMGYNNPGSSKKISFMVLDYRKPNNYNEGENVYIADQNFKIINAAHPNATNFEDQYLTQKATENDRLVYIILDFEGKVVTKYNEYDYYLYNYFAPFKLNDPVFIEQNAARFSGYKEINRLDYNDPQYIGYFYSFHPYNESLREPRIWKGLHFLNKKTSDIFLTLSPEKYKDPRVFDTGQVSVYNIPLERTEIYNFKGTMLYSLPFDAINNTKEKYFRIIKGDSLNLADKKTHQILFSNFYSDIKIIGETGLFAVKKGKHYGIIDHKDRIVRPFDYAHIRFNEKKPGYINLYKDHTLEYLNTGSEKTDMIICHDPKTRTTGNDSYGIVYYDERVAVDHYGNVFYNIKDERIFRPYISK
ncbi:WG repeat-containing protein [Chryseobacterium sp.]|uniref:WG repeat-containing protein n=1 Tax=Chryseobacterium sp. TaxID=1871047 RepID=UPI000EE18033|nr:WG repeat-containing protein [Chryseobacterium sp.]HCA05671.1 hypothetical protein [Chryseobacterium sp.]